MALPVTTTALPLPLAWRFSISARPAATTMPPPVLFMIVVSVTKSWPVAGWKLTALLAKLAMTQCSMWTCAAATTSTPLFPWPLGLPGSGLSIERLRRCTIAAALLMMMSLLPPTTSDPAIDPPEPSMVSDLVMVTAPNPPGSSTLMKPPAAVLLMAPANVLHGAVRLHGFTSSPTPDTQVRFACAYAAGAVIATITAPSTDVRMRARVIVITLSLSNYRFMLAWVTPQRAQW